MFLKKISVDDQWKDIGISLGSLQIDSCLLLPRPYPGFLPLKFKTDAQKKFQLQDAEKLQIALEPKEKSNKLQSVEVELVWLEK